MTPEDPIVEAFVNYLRDIARGRLIALPRWMQ